MRRVTATAKPDPLTGEGVPSSSAAPISLRVNLQIDAGREQGSVDVWAGKDHYSADSHGHPPDADPTVRKLVDVLRRSDWSGLYDLMASEVKANITRDQFIAGIQATIKGTPVSIEAQSRIAYSSTVLTQAQVTLTINYRDSSDAKIVVIRPVALLIWEQHGWYLLDLREPGANPSSAGSVRA